MRVLCTTLQERLEFAFLELKSMVGRSLMEPWAKIHLGLLALPALPSSVGPSLGAKGGGAGYTVIVCKR